MYGYAGFSMVGITVAVGDIGEAGGPPNPSTGTGILITAPAHRFATNNYGLYVNDFGSTTGDYAIYVSGGLSHFGGTTEFSAVPSLPSQSANEFLASADGAPGIPAFRAMAPNDYPTMVGDSGAGGTKGAVPAPGSGDTAAAKFLKADGSWQIPSVPASSAAWDTLTAPSGNLTLNCSSHSTEFDQTSNIAWLWKNTTTATSGTTNASPLLEAAANYWNGSSSLADTWAIGAALSSGTNGVSTLSLTHSGSSGNPYVNLASHSSYQPALIIGGDTTAGIGSTAAGSISLYVASTNGIHFVGLAAVGSVNEAQWSLDNSASVMNFGVTAGNRTMYIGFTSGSNAFTTGNINLLTFGTTGTSLAATSGTFQRFVYEPSTFNPASGAVAFVAHSINPTVNQTSTASGNYTALQVNVVETSLKGSANLLLDLQAGSTGGTSEFSVNNVGKITKYNAITTAGNGVASEIFQDLQSSLNADYNSGTAKTLFTPTVAKAYRISAAMGANVAATAGTMPSLTVGWTDVGGIARTFTLLAQTITSATSDYVQGSLKIYTDNATAVTVTSASYAAGSGTALTYSLAITAETM